MIEVEHKAGRVERLGHLHWKAVPVRAGRKLVDGRVVAETNVLRKLTVNTRCTAKWAAVDLETCQAYEGSPVGWMAATLETNRALAAAVVSHSKFDASLYDLTKTTVTDAAGLISKCESLHSRAIDLVDGIVGGSEAAALETIKLLRQDLDALEGGVRGTVRATNQSEG